jgi:murein DD-endopeptidase MepM/ murein hydrolase activator NlpD
MKNRFSNNFNLGKLNITLFPGEIIIVYSGKKRILVKTIPRNFTPGIKKPLTAAAIILISLVIFKSISSSSSLSDSMEQSTEEISDKGTETDLDEERKNMLLSSRDTDYTEEKESSGFTVSEHRVVKGEVLSQIAKRYGVSMDTICGSNDLQSYDLINEGALLKIPSKDGILYKMKMGKDLLSVAKKYKVELGKILTANYLKNPDFIPVGTTVFIPDARPQNIFPGFLWPTISRVVTCGYGWRRNPFNRKRKEFHQGMDIRAKYERIRSTKFGKIAYAGWLGGYGNVIIVAHPGKIKTLYAHLSKIYVRKGQYVKQGQFIGRSGNTGRSTGAHLHFEVIRRGKPINPFIYLRRR